MNRLILHTGIGVLSLLLIVITTFGLISEAHAVATDATPHPAITSPIIRPAETSGPVKLQLDGGYGTGIRRIAREADEKIGGLKILRRGSCDRMSRNTCLRIKYVHRPNAGWYAQSFAKSIDRRVIQVNLDVPNGKPYAVICHEFGHILGLAHHAEKLGVDGGVPDLIHFSRHELQALRAAYPRA